MPKLFLALICITCFASAVGAQEGSPAPDFTLQDVDGKSFRAADYLGRQPILMDFWATWCGPCKTELPHLDDIYQDFKEQGLLFLAISEDSPRSASKVKPYVRSMNYAATVLMDPDGQVLRKYFGSSLPHTVLIDRNGKIARTFQGYVPGQERDIRKLVSELTASAEGSAPAPDPAQSDSSTGDNH